jgi:hypothetical protein
MLHIVMDIKRHEPPRDQRLDGENSVVAAQAYRNVIRRLFQQAEIVVAEDRLDRNALTADLDEIIQRGEKYREGS